MTNKYAASTVSLLLCALVAFSCAPQHEGDVQEVTAGNWGHLTALSKVNPTKMYLSHLKKGEAYKICLANYMVEKYPGIENELKAAANIWAHYIDRKVPVEILKTDLPVAYPEDEEGKVMEQYYARCPKGVHLVVGESYFTDSAVGKTQTSYSYRPKNGRQEVVSFQRALFLKMPVQEGELPSEDEAQVVWKSLAQVMGKELSSEEILEVMKKRDQKVYLTGQHELLTFKTIVHEFGHIWGMCDQYALGGNKTNCDGSFATINDEGHIVLDDEAMMAKSSWVAKLYLTDDDIEGVRRLAERPEFTHDWPLATGYRSIKVADVASVPQVALAKLNFAKLNGSDLKLNLSLVTGVPVEVKVRIFSKTYNQWMEDYSNFELSKAVTYKDWTLTLGGARRYGPEKIEISVGTKNKSDVAPVALSATVIDETTAITIKQSEVSVEPEEETETSPEEYF